MVSGLQDPHLLWLLQGEEAEESGEENLYSSVVVFVYFSSLFTFLFVKGNAAIHT